ncbi:hypothetical protein ACQJBY_029458 [Aegilops geniculata]
MESMGSAALSIGSTTAMGVEDDANSFALGMIHQVENDGNSYHTPTRTSSLPFCGSRYDPECDPNLQPVIGMQFDTWEEGMAIYKIYAHEVGFSVRTWTTHKDEHGVVWKRFVCAREGWRKVTQEEERIKPKRKFKLTRCGCEAMIGLKRQDDGKYKVARFVQSHTHQLISPSKRHLIKSNREVSSELRSKLLTCHKAMVGTSAAYRLLTVEKGGPENVGCTKRDFQNSHRDFKRAIKGADGQIIVDIMKRVNNHRSCVTFGAAFLWNEKKESYIWLFKTFLKAMSGVAPKLIMTDEDQSMRIGIEQVFPNTIHRLVCGTSS